MLWAVSRAPLDKLQVYRQRMGSSFPWASSTDSDFRALQPQPPAAASTDGPFAAWAATTGTDWPTYTRERPGVSAFALEDGVVYHTYSAYSRGLDGLWGMYQWLDRAPSGRNEGRAEGDPLNFFRRHDEYDRAWPTGPPHARCGRRN